MDFIQKSFSPIWGHIFIKNGWSSFLFNTSWCISIIRLWYNRHCFSSSRSIDQTHYFFIRLCGNFCMNTIRFVLIIMLIIMFILSKIICHLSLNPLNISNLINIQYLNPVFNVFAMLLFFYNFWVKVVFFVFHSFVTFNKSIHFGDVRLFESFGCFMIKEFVEIGSELQLHFVNVFDM